MVNIMPYNFIRRPFRIATLAAAIAMTTFTSSAFAQPNVVVSIKPVHSLVAAVMKGVGKPDLIVDGASSPHNYALKPSQAQALQNADVVFWVGHTLETFLEKPLETIAANATAVELIEAKGVIQRDFRDAKSDHKDEHADHKEEHAGHDHGSADPHIWLDPINAKAMIIDIREALTKAAPEHSQTFEKNTATLIEQLDQLTKEVSTDLGGIKDKPFVVFHDAYRHFEDRFGLSKSRAVTISPEVKPGAGRIKDLREDIQKMGATCVFAEPQFSPSLVQTLIEGSEARSGVIDPLGATLENGPELYFNLIRNMTASIKECLVKTG